MTEKTPKLGGRDRFQPADFSIQRFAAKVPAEITLKDVLHPEFFSNHLDKMKSGMEITVLSDDNKLDVRLRVLSVTSSTASLRVLDDYSQAEETNAKQDGAKATKAAKAPAKAKQDGEQGNEGGEGAGDTEGKLSLEDLKVSHGGPHHNWRFAHGDKVIEHGFGSKADAEAAAEEYVKKANG